MTKDDLKIIEETGKRYNEIIFSDDYIPKYIYEYQINLRDNIINRCMKNRKFKYVIDLGCGTGFHLKTLSQYSENLIGVDISFNALKECKRVAKCDCVVCDVKRLPFKNNMIDFIWIAGVLHHVPDELNDVISNLSRILKDNGLILIDEPNKLNIFNYINMKLSKADPTGKERPMSLKNVGKILNSNDIVILESELYELFTPIGILLKNGTILNLSVALDKFISRTFLRNIQLRWYVLASREDRNKI